MWRQRETGKILEKIETNEPNLKHSIDEDEDEEDVDEEDLITHIPDEIKHAFPHTFAGFDKLNQPVWVIPFGSWDVKGMLNAKERNDKLMRLYLDQRLHQILESAMVVNATKWVFVFDMAGYSCSQLASFRTITFELQLLRKYAHLFDTLAYGYIVNLGYFSKKLVSMASPLLGSLLDRIELLGTDKKKNAFIFLKKIPAGQLPEEYGAQPGHIPVQSIN